MCGIWGIIDPKNLSPEKILEAGQAMGNAIRTRGPDGHGVWSSVDNRVTFGHRRLSVLDLSSHGHQPMVLENRLVMAYNGEIYNFQDIKSKLHRLGRRFNGTGDTEVLIQAIDEWGIEGAVNKLIGMFAFAIFDRSNNKVFLVRDRLGIKPLHYGFQGNTFLFSSELKSILAHPENEKSIDSSSVQSYIFRGYVPSPQSILSGYHKLESGSILSFSLSDVKGTLSVNRFWDPFNESPLSTSSVEAESQLENLLEDSVKGRLISDVPIGVFLSGGVDSSLVSAIAQKVASNPIRTFSIGFERKEYDESKFARDIANHLGTVHEEYMVTDADALRVVPKLSEIYSEPFADPSQIPTYLVCEIARKQVTVVLSGDGGDELFVGYNRYLKAQRFFEATKKLPFRGVAAKIVSKALPLLGSCGFGPTFNQRMRVLSEVLPYQDFYELYFRYLSIWRSTIFSNQLIQKTTQLELERDRYKWVSSRDHLRQMSVFDMQTYMRDDILTKVDSASMAHSLEVRVPILDHRIVEYALKLPTQYKIEGNNGKAILKQILQKHVPRSLTDRNKRGFSAPIAQWLRGPLSEWAHDMLTPQMLDQHNFFNKDVVQKMLKSHMKSESNWSSVLWTLLMFQQWYDHYISD